MRVGIIGAGASGIICALKASSNNDVYLFEKNNKIGKKILMTGNGKCNLWNMNLLKNDINLSDYYYASDYNMLNNIANNFLSTYNYLKNDLNIFMRNKDNYIYPYSNSALSVQKTFEYELSRRNVNVLLDKDIKKIEKCDNGYKIICESDAYEVDKVVISCGTKSSNINSSSVDDFINDLNLKYKEFKPSLVPIKLKSKYLNDWNGIRTNAKLSLYNNDTLIKEEVGEVQLTDYGISGIVSFNLSGYVNRTSDNLHINIDFMPDYNEDELLNLFKKIKNDKKIEEVLETLFNYKLMYVILDNTNINKNNKWNTLSDNDYKALINSIKSFKVTVSSTLDFDRSQVSTGGILLSELNDNLELKASSGIYIIGEILDIDGLCGGYNLALCFTTGYMVGCDLNDKN